MADYAKPVTIRLTANQANFLWAMMQSTVDGSDDRNTVRYAKAIRDRLDKAASPDDISDSSRG